MSESFLLSNMAPQVGSGFNRGIWRSLENRVRKWTLERGEVYVITGAIPGDDPEKISGTTVTVPERFFKIIFDPVRVDAIAFILPNESNPTSQLHTFITSVDVVEEETGLDFLSELNDSVEVVVESKVQADMW